MHIGGRGLVAGLWLVASGCTLDPEAASPAGAYVGGGTSASNSGSTGSTASLATVTVVAAEGTEVLIADETGGFLGTELIGKTGEVVLSAVPQNGYVSVVWTELDARSHVVDTVAGVQDGDTLHFLWAPTEEPATPSYQTVGQANVTADHPGGGMTQLRFEDDCNGRTLNLPADVVQDIYEHCRNADGDLDIFGYGREGPLRAYSAVAWVTDAEVVGAPDELEAQAELVWNLDPGRLEVTYLHTSSEEELVSLVPTAVRAGAPTNFDVQANFMQPSEVETAQLLVDQQYHEEAWFDLYHSRSRYEYYGDTGPPSPDGLVLADFDQMALRTMSFGVPIPGNGETASVHVEPSDHAPFIDDIGFDLANLELSPVWSATECPDLEWDGMQYEVTVALGYTGWRHFLTAPHGVPLRLPALGPKYDGIFGQVTGLGAIHLKAAAFAHENRTPADRRTSESRLTRWFPDVGVEGGRRCEAYTWESWIPELAP